MAAQHRNVRWTPVDRINPFERVDAMDYIAKGLRQLGFALKCEFRYDTGDAVIRPWFGDGNGGWIAQPKTTVNNTSRSPDISPGVTSRGTSWRHATVLRLPTYGAREFAVELVSIENSDVFLDIAPVGIGGVDAANRRYKKNLLTVWASAR